MALAYALSVRATRDLRRIRQWIAKGSGAVRAEAIMGRLKSAFSTLGEQPLAGRSRAELGRGLRTFAVRPYLIVYRAQPDRVVVVRVLDGRRDVPRVLRDGVD